MTHKTSAYLRQSEAAKKFVLRTNVLGQILIFFSINIVELYKDFTALDPCM